MILIGRQMYHHLVIGSHIDRAFLHVGRLSVCDVVCRLCGVINSTRLIITDLIAVRVTVVTMLLCSCVCACTHCDCNDTYDV